ncbi:hypothetical protein R6Q59_002196 [Mikania micrantha]
MAATIKLLDCYPSITTSSQGAGDPTTEPPTVPSLFQRLKVHHDHFLSKEYQFALLMRTLRRYNIDQFVSPFHIIM